MTRSTLPVKPWLCNKKQVHSLHFPLLSVGSATIASSLVVRVCKEGVFAEHLRLARTSTGNGSPVTHSRCDSLARKLVPSLPLHHGVLCDHSLYLLVLSLFHNTSAWWKNHSIAVFLGKERGVGQETGTRLVSLIVSRFCLKLVSSVALPLYLAG